MDTLKEFVSKYLAKDINTKIDAINAKLQEMTAPVIRPFENFSIHPFNSTLHYALECFEGAKVSNNLNPKRPSELKTIK